MHPECSYSLEMGLNKEVKSFSVLISPHSGQRDECFGPDLTFDPAGLLDAAPWCSAPSRLSFIFTPGLPPPHSDSICSCWRRRPAPPAENRVSSHAWGGGGGGPNAAVSLLQLHQDGRSEHIRSGICHISAFQLAQFTFPVRSRRTAVMENHWPTAPGLHNDK